MAITLVGANKVIQNGQDPALTNATGITVVAGDFVLAGYVTDGATSFSLSDFGLHGDSTATVGSWTTLLNSTSALDDPTAMFGYAVAATSGLVRPQINLSNNFSNGQAICAVFRGDGGVGNITAVARGTSTTPATATVAPSAAGDWVIGIYGGMRGTGTWTNTATWTNVVSDAAPYNDTGWVNFGIEYKEAANTTPFSGAPTLDSATDKWVALSFVLELAPVITPGTTVARGLYL